MGCRGRYTIGDVQPDLLRLKALEVAVLNTINHKPGNSWEIYIKLHDRADYDTIVSTMESLASAGFIKEAQDGHYLKQDSPFQ